jgi:hypothetical protein
MPLIGDLGKLLQALPAPTYRNILPLFQHALLKGVVYTILPEAYVL